MLVKGGKLSFITKDWAVNTEFLQNEIVRYKRLLFKALFSHTSDGSDFANDLDKWEVLTDESKVVNQASHGFSVLQPVYFDGSNWMGARSNANNTLGEGIVAIISTNYFVVVKDDDVEVPNHGLIVGDFYFVSASSSTLTATKPTNNFHNPIVKVLDSDTINVFQMLPVNLDLSDVSPAHYTNTTTKTANYTATLSDDVILVNASSGIITITLPVASTATNKDLWIMKKEASINAVTVEGNGSETINNNLNVQILANGNAGDSVHFHCDGSAWWII